MVKKIVLAIVEIILSLVLPPFIVHIIATVSSSQYEKLHSSQYLQYDTINKLYFDTALFFLVIILLVISSTLIAIDSGRKTKLFILSKVLLIVSIGIAVFLSIRHIEFAIVFAVILISILIIALLDKEKPIKQEVRNSCYFLWKSIK